MVRRTKEDADETRNRLLDAAEQVFYDKGVSRASLAEIALAAGVTRGAIYWHFKDKVDLFNAMMDRVTLPLEAACGRVQHEVSVEEPLQRMRSTLTGLFRDIASNVRACRVFEIAMYRVEYVDEVKEVRERHQQAVARFTAELARELEAAMRTQQISLPMGVAVAATGLQALFDGLLQAWMLGGNAFELEVVGCAAVDVYLRGLGFEV